MLAGLIAGLLVFGFARLFGEPPLGRALSFEAAIEDAKEHAEAAKGMPAMDEPALVSRDVQAGLGLFTGVTVYCTAFGGLFALVFAVASGRAGTLRPRSLSALLALAGFVAIYLVPAMKYPASPPAIGAPDTIGLRTALYFIAIALSAAAMTGAAVLRMRLAPSRGPWLAALSAVAAYVVLIAAVLSLLPGIDEVPDDFPAAVLWQFRGASFGMQVVMWSTIGLVFGILTERAAVGRHGLGRRVGLRA
jgi:predicted cobalt transporter CbtA